MEIHPRFELNGLSLNGEALQEVAYSWVKEGKDFEKSAGDFLLDWFSPSEFLIVSTSGSTGTPKPIELRKEFMVNSAMTTGKYFDLNPGDAALLCLSADFIAGKMMLVRAMVLGLHLDIVPADSSPLNGRSKVYDFAAMVPLQVDNSLNELKKVKKLIIGGAAIAHGLKEQLSKLTNAIYETYGMTETITHIAVKKISNTDQDKSEKYFETLPGVKINKDRRDCLVINAPSISTEMVITNDLVDIIDEGHFKWLGRFDNVINSGGVKLIPEQIEEKLATIISNRFFVIGLKDETLGEKLVLVVEGNKQTELRASISSLTTLSKYEMPKAIYFLPKFLETDSGKVMRSKTITTLI